MFAGTSRDDTPFPVQYLGANVPQAWAAGTVFILLRALLGAEIDVPSATLYVDPCLPDWLPELRLKGLHVGRHVVDLHVWRDNGDTHMQIIRDDSVRLVRRSLSHALRSGVG